MEERGGAVTDGAPIHPAQWAFAGLAVLLALLVLATPGLLGGVGGPTAGSPATEAALWIDATPGNVTHFYVEGIAHVRYAEIRVATGALAVWPVVGGLGTVRWSAWTNGSDVVVLATNTPANPVAVNVSAVYVDATGTTVYYLGAYALYTTDSSLRIQPLMNGLDPGTPDYALSDLPGVLPLLASSTGG
jgi:hypothetical protein